MWWWGFGDGGIMGWNMLFSGIFWVLLLVVFVWAVTRFTQRSDAQPADDALEIARRRLASGDITIEQFEELQRALKR